MQLFFLLLALLLPMCASQSNLSSSKQESLFYLLVSKAKTPIASLQLSSIIFHAKNPDESTIRKTIPISLTGTLLTPNVDISMDGKSVEADKEGSFKHATGAILEGQNLHIPVAAKRNSGEKGEIFIKILVPQALIADLQSRNFAHDLTYSLGSEMPPEPPPPAPPAETGVVNQTSTDDATAEPPRDSRHFSASTALITPTQSSRFAPLIFFSLLDGFSHPKLQRLTWEARLGVSLGENADSSQVVLGSLTAAMHSRLWKGLNLGAGTGFDYWFRSPGRLYFFPLVSLSYVFYPHQPYGLERIFLENLWQLGAQRNSHQIALGVSFRL